jgi:phosphoribosylformylglycinamidine cyclo-ligase
MQDDGKMMTYAGAGVDYGPMDRFKRMAQAAGLETAGNINRLNGGEFRELEMSRGESCYLIEAAKSYFAHVEEGLGTKNLVADAMHNPNERSYYDNVGQDTVAMIVNDMITLGALPLSVAMHLAVGDSKWFNDEDKVHDLIDGWQHACNLAGCVWGGGETPTLKDIIVPGSVVLSGSAMGLVKPKERLIDPANIKNGDAIIFLESSGIHANGLTLAREIAKKLPDGYFTRIGGGRHYGEALLDPTFIYVPFIEACFDCGIDIHYAVNITGHGWRKLMRAERPFAYVIEQLPDPLPIFDFIQQHGSVDDREMYGNFNMGAGFAIYVAERDVRQVLKVARVVERIDNTNSYHAFRAGRIELVHAKQVIIEPKGLQYFAESLAVR